MDQLQKLHRENLQTILDAKIIRGKRKLSIIQIVTFKQTAYKLINQNNLNHLISTSTNTKPSIQQLLNREFFLYCPPLNYHLLSSNLFQT